MTTQTEMRVTRYGKTQIKYYKTLGGARRALKAELKKANISPKYYTEVVGLMIEIVSSAINDVEVLSGNWNGYAFEYSIQ